MIVLIALGAFGYYTKNIAPTNVQSVSFEDRSISRTKVNSKKFKCDGRQHCSQMNSRAEAVYFINNCPNTKMDGDYDGIPCENDSRF